MLLEETTAALQPIAGMSIAQRLRRLLLRFGFPLSLLCLLALGLVSFWADSSIERAAEWRLRAFQIRRSLAELRLQLNSLESEQRSFVITGDPSYFRHYRQSHEDVKHDLELLRHKVSDPAQQRLLARLKPLVFARLSRLDATLVIRQREGLDQARRAIVSGHGKALMDEISQLSQALEEAQDALIVRRERELQATLLRSRWAVLAGTVLTILVLTSLYRRLAAKVRERKQIVSRLRDANSAAEAANAAKDELLTLLSHEIRTPINGVLGLLDMVLATDLTATQRRDLEAAHAAAESLRANILTARFGVAGRTDSQSRVEEAPRQRRHAGLRILMAEDNPMNETFMVSLLAHQGHRVTVAHNGLEAVQKASAGAFDVILMDVQMPEMNGLEAAAAIRRREEGSSCHVPMVALTASAMKGDRDRCLAAGMDRYLAKPVRASELVDLLSEIDAAA